MQLLLQFQQLIIVKVQSVSYSQSDWAHDPLQAAQDSAKTECNTLELLQQLILLRFKQVLTGSLLLLHFSETHSKYQARKSKAEEKNENTQRVTERLKGHLEVKRITQHVT